jgi:hypothetical protein
MVQELRMGRISQEARQNVSVEAIRLLHKEYKDRLSALDFIKTIEFIENKAKAEVFLNLTDKAIRDLWLENSCTITFLDFPEHDNDVQDC